MTRSVQLGPLTLACAEPYELMSSHGEHGDRVDQLVQSSPDHTVYHSRAYTDLRRAEGCLAEVVLVMKNRELVFGFPAYPESKLCFDSGFCGFLFPATSSERVLRRSVAALEAFFAFNPHIRRFSAIQSVLGAGARDTTRRAQLDWLLSTAKGFATTDLFTRVIELPKSSEQVERVNGEGRLAAGDLDPALLKSYDGDVRNQIRQAERNGLSLRYAVIATPAPAAIERAYLAYGPLHGQSWERTGLHARPLPYWHRLSTAVVGGGALDLVVTVVDASDAVLAGVSIQIYQQQAIYWSGGSTPEGQRSRANPLALHAALTLCRRLGVEWFEIGRFEAHETEKLRAIRHYKSQFGGKVLRVSNVKLERRDWQTVALDEVWRFRYQMPTNYPTAWRFVRHVAELRSR